MMKVSMGTVHTRMWRHGFYQAGFVDGAAFDVQVAELGVPFIMMHMRGDPSTMQSAENTAYKDVCADVGRELQSTAAAAMRSGIEPWRIIPDPGRVMK